MRTLEKEASSEAPSGSDSHILRDENDTQDNLRGLATVKEENCWRRHFTTFRVNSQEHAFKKIRKRSGRGAQPRDIPAPTALTMWRPRHLIKMTPVGRRGRKT